MKKQKGQNLKCSYPEEVLLYVHSVIQNIALNWLFWLSVIIFKALHKDRNTVVTI